MKKKFFWGLAASIALLGGSFGCNGLQTDSSETAICSIRYQYWDESLQDVKELPSFMWKPDGTYPSRYQETKKTTVHGLRHFRKDADTIYAFEGWYYDAAYQNKMFNNEIASTVRGDVILYAKIVEREKQTGDVVTASISYKWENLQDKIADITTLPSAMTTDVILPTEYIEGEGISVPNLKNCGSDKTGFYEFEGWYYDAALRNGLTQGAISKTTTGNLVLYANIGVYL